MEYEERSTELEQEADRLEQERDRVAGHIDEARRDWESKKSDESIPGAVEDLEAEAEAEGEEGDAARGKDDEADDEPPRSGEQADAGQ